MSVRDLIIISVFGYFLFKTFKKPYIGVGLMLCITHMSPHREAAWTFSYSLPFYQVAFLVTLLSYFFNKDDKQKFPWHGQFILLVMFFIWGTISTIFAMHPEWAMAEFHRSYKMLLGVAIVLLLCQGENRIKMVIWVIVISIGFYGLKGGVFTVLTGAQFRVLGPPGGYIGGNNEFALALLMTIPLMFFIFTELKNKWFKLMLAGVIALCFISVVGSHSRGAFLGLIATAAFLVWKSKYKLPLAALGLIAVISFIPFIPQHWYERMQTIQNYEQDGSAMGRINSWTVAVNVANDRVTGGGYRFWGPVAFALYAPIPDKLHDAHSIYFEVLGELGWPGLLIYLMLLLGWWRIAGKNAKMAAGHEHLAWCVTLSKMSQVSQVAYMSAGAFLGLAYWDFPYHIMAVMVLVQLHIKQHLAQVADSKQPIKPRLAQ